MDDAINSTQACQTLVVGDMRSWEKRGRIIPMLDGVQFVDEDSIRPSFIRQIKPEMILSTLVGRDHDAVEIARKLQNMEYKGSYRVLITDIPNADLILREVRSSAPDVDFDVIDLADLVKPT